MTNLYQQARRTIIKTYVITVSLGILTSSLVAYSAFSPNTLLSADQLNQELAALRPLGVGQDWINMLDSTNPTGEVRSAGQQYLNNTGRPIMVVVTVTGSAGSVFSISPQVNGTWQVVTETANTNSPADKGSISVIVPNNYWYKYDTSALAHWYELREVAK